MNQELKERRIILNRIRCNMCSDIITSYNRHDFKRCACGGCAVDGGYDYFKRSGYAYTDMSVMSDAPFDVIRGSFHRGGRGKDGMQPIKYTLLKDMSNEWIRNCILYNDKYVGNRGGWVNDIYTKELEYREKNGIHILD